MIEIKVAQQGRALIRVAVSSVRDFALFEVLADNLRRNARVPPPAE